MKERMCLGQGRGVFQWGPNEVMSSNISEWQLAAAGNEREGDGGRWWGGGRVRNCLFPDPATIKK